MILFSPAECLPEWALQHRHCPYGVKMGLLFSHFTWPGEGATLSHYVAAFYSMNPFMVIAGALGLLLWFRGTRELLLLTFMEGVSLPTILVMKNILAEKRPEGSCLLGCGMPSGHAMLSIGLMCWLGLELVLQSGTSGPAARQRSIIALVLLALFFLPVGWSRVVLHDHDWPQVFVGSAIGAVLGIVWHFVLRLPCASSGIEALASSKALLLARVVDNYALERRDGDRAAHAAVTLGLQSGLEPGYGSAPSARSP